MNFIKRLVIFIGALTVVFSSSAASTFCESCPLINVIKSEGLSMAEETTANNFMTFQVSQYNTDASWVFAVGPFEANSYQNAKDRGNKFLASMYGEAIPIKEKGSFFCIYYTDDSKVSAIAVEANATLSAKPNLFTALQKIIQISG